MHLFYFALGIGRGDEVIVPAQTHTATAHAVELAGAKPVFIDCDSSTGNIDPQKIQEKNFQEDKSNLCGSFFRHSSGYEKNKFNCQKK